LVVKKIKLWPIGVVLLLFGCGLWYLSRPFPAPVKMQYGVTFSKPFAEKLGLDWKELYAGVLDDLGARKIRLPAYWNEIESKEGVYDFSDLEWQVKEAEKRNAEIILAVGRKLPRWPECHEPGWLNNPQPYMAEPSGFRPTTHNQQQQNEYKQQKLLKYIEETINHFKNYESVKYWQVENEPFLSFGECPELDKKFLESEIELVRLLDSSRPILLTDSGEFGRWVQASSRADIFGTTMYFQIYHNWLGQFRYPLGPGFFRVKSRLADIIAGKKQKMVIEFQMEPWNKKQIYETGLDEQLAVFPENDFNKRIEFVKKTGFDTVYLWGVEWWWRLGVKHDNWGYWNKAKELFKDQKPF